MPPVLGPVSPSPTRLKSCAGSSGTHGRAVARGRTATPRARRGTPRAAPGARVQQAAAWARAASRSSVTTTPLPAARPSSLTTYGGPKRSSAASRLRRVCRRSRGGRWAPRRRPSRPWRTPWSPRCRAAAARRAEAGDAGGPHRVGDARRPAAPRARSTTRSAPSRRPGRRRAAGSATSSGRAARRRRRAGVAGRADQRGDGGVLGQREDEGVLTGAGADDQNAHGRQA